jgi:hypothetical protein
VKENPMASKFSTGDRVRAVSAWTGRSEGKGTVATVGDHGCGVELDKQQGGGPAHFYDSELTKVNEQR